MAFIDSCQNSSNFKLLNINGDPLFHQSFHIKPIYIISVLVSVLNIFHNQFIFLSLLVA